MTHNWERRGNAWFLTEGDKQYKLAKTDEGWYVWDRNVGDYRWTVFAVAATRQEAEMAVL